MRVDDDTPNRTPDPSRLSRADSPDPKGDVLTAKIVACGRGEENVLWMEVEVSEVIEEANTTRIKLDFGHNCTMAFTVPALVKVPRFIRFKTVLEPKT